MKKIFKYFSIGTIALVATWAIFLSGPLAHAAGGIPTVTFNPSWGPYGVMGGSLTLSPGPYTQDFRVTMCLVPTLPGGQNGTPAPTSDPVPTGEPPNAQCVTTPWASTLGTSSYSFANPLTTIWAGQAQDDPFWCDGYNCVPYITVQTQPLPVGTTIQAALGIEFADDNAGPPPFNYNCDQWTNTDGGTSGIAYGYTYGSCLNSNELSQKPNYFRLFMSGFEEILNAQESANNIPTSTIVNQQMTTGTNGSPLSITMKNTGSWPWFPTFTSQDTGTPTGTCAPGSDQPPSSTATTTCSVLVTLTSENYFLAHTPSSFQVASETIPIIYTGVTKTTTHYPAYSYSVNLPCAGGGSSFTQQPAFIPFINTAYASQYLSGGLCPATFTASERWITSYSGGGYQSRILPGGSVSFLMSSITAPSLAGTYIEKWQMQTAQSSGAFGSVFTLPITVNPGVPPSATPTGTITVASENAAFPSIPVTASWDLSGQVGNGFICAVDPVGQSPFTLWDSSIPCSGTQQTYSGVPASNDLVGILPGSEHTTISGYTFNSIEQAPIAEKKNSNILSSLGLSLNNIFSTVAFADTINTIDQGQTYTNMPSWTLTPQTSPVTFAILWTPNSNMQISQGSAQLTPSSQSQTITVTNSGVPGSELDWMATTSTTSGGNWLVVSSPNGAITNPATGVSTNTVIVSYDSSVVSNLPNGTYYGKVIFSGTDPKNTLNHITPSPVLVTLVVSSSGISITGISVSCSPSAIYTNGNSVCSANVIGTGVTGGVNWSTNIGTIDPSGHYTATSTIGWATITATSQQDPSQSSTAQIDISAPPLPTCTSANCQVTCSPSLTANPASIVVPESSSLSYSCSHVTACQLSGGQFGTGTPAAANNTISVTPTITTTYTLTCTNSNYSNDSAGSTATVTVGGSSLCEQNPNGVGCPGQ